MKHFLALAGALGLTAATAPQVTVVTADGDWSRLPVLGQYGYDHLNTKVMVKLHEIVKHRECQLPGYVNGRLDFGVSFAAQFNPDGSLREIVIPKLNCPEAEGVVGGALLEMINGGDYRPKGRAADGWYRGNLTFAFEA